MINLLKIFLKYAHVSYFHHFTNWNVQFWVLLSLSTMISKISTLLNKKMCAPLSPRGRGSFTSTVSKEMNNLPRLPQIFIGNWAAAYYSCGWPDLRGLNRSCGWFYPAANRRSGGWIRFATVSSSGSWIQVTTESSCSGWLHPTAKSYSWLEFRQLDTSCGCHKFLRMDTSYDWLHRMADSSSGGWIQVVANSILWLTLVSAAV